MLQPLDSSISFQLNLGIDENGKQIVGRATLARLRDTLTDDELKEIAQIFISLVKHPVIAATIHRSNEIVQF